MMRGIFILSDFVNEGMGRNVMKWRRGRKENKT